MTQQRYVLVVRDPKDSWSTSLVDDLQGIVPEVKVIEMRGNVYLLEAPIHCEADLFHYCDNEHCIISRQRTYHLLSTGDNSNLSKVR